MSKLTQNEENLVIDAAYKIAAKQVSFSHSLFEHHFMIALSQIIRDGWGQNAATPELKRELYNVLLRMKS